MEKDVEDAIRQLRTDVGTLADVCRELIRVIEKDDGSKPLALSRAKQLLG